MSHEVKWETEPSELATSPGGTWDEEPRNHAREGGLISSQSILRRRTFVPREEAISVFRTAPKVDASQFQADADAAFDQNLPESDG